MGRQILLPLSHLGSPTQTLGKIKFIFFPVVVSFSFWYHLQGHATVKGYDCLKWEFFPLLNCSLNSQDTIISEQQSLACWTAKQNSPWNSFLELLPWKSLNQGPARAGPISRAKSLSTATAVSHSGCLVEVRGTMLLTEENEMVTHSGFLLAHSTQDQIFSRRATGMKYSSVWMWTTISTEISKPLNLKSCLGSPTKRHQVTFAERQNSKRKSYTYDKKNEKEKTSKKARSIVRKSGIWSRV